MRNRRDNTRVSGRRNWETIYYLIIEKTEDSLLFKND